MMIPVRKTILSRTPSLLLDQPLFFPILALPRRLKTRFVYQRQNTCRRRWVCVRWVWIQRDEGV